ncbi:MAG TPA: class I SAM-dependent methyltransferase [Acidimicrobiales bacterium]|nr:class I SAM-dependent methyltransferase [Acidimicrobiales bacterium]
MAETHFDDWTATHMEVLWPELYEASAIDPAVAFLAALAGSGGALEFGIGTGRVAIPLRRAGTAVHGIELSAAMAGRLHTDAGALSIGVTVGDFATSRVEGRFRLVYLVRNTITNLTTQAEQVLCFRNAAEHLEPGGHFVIENYVPELRRLPPGETTHLFEVSPTHVGFETYDLARQIAVSTHHWIVDGQHRQFSSPHRYVWPSELDLMALMAGMVLVQRWADWDRTAFDGESRSHVSVWQKPPGGR